MSAGAAAEAEANGLINLVYDYLLDGEPGKAAGALERVKPLYERERWNRWRFYEIRHQAAEAELRLVEGDLDRFRVVYNEHRPHRALHRRTPASVWAEKPKAVPAQTATAAASATTRIANLTVADNGVVRTQGFSIGTGIAYWMYVAEKGKPAGINLLDYGCIRIFPSKFVGGVVDLYHGLLKNDEALIVHAYETWGFKRLSRELIDILNIWARFIYGPLLEDRVRTLADGVKPSEYGRREAFRVHQALKQQGPVRVPREFVFMDRAAIGLGAVFLHLAAKLNYYRLFNEAIDQFSVAKVGARQKAALAKAGLVGNP